MAGAVVVKIGGSVAKERSRLRTLLHELADRAPGEIVVVPGGGVFADAVRDAQRRLGFNDSVAHRLALDAMGSMAQAFKALEPRLRQTDDVAGIRRAWRSSAIPLWHPAALREGHPEIPESWDVTSDSLAVWLATQLGAERCVLVKSSIAVPEGTPAAWSRAGLVDAAFPQFAARFGGEIVIHGTETGDLGGALARPGTRT
ncbi:uridylate kinase [Enterovirga sp. CN4-39]|uniref:amino acid kinase family protein n=1 Tax=Enterovirga sp. CN4-39 TaxID=3400910 RepID=UPI003BFF49CA